MLHDNRHDRDLPLFNLKAVANETGLKPDTLRAWERRYGIPAPQRTPGGHRLYSRNDMEQLRWLVARQLEGLSISRAVELWQIGKGPGAPAASVDAAEADALPALPAPAARTGALDALRSRWVTACLRFDEAAAEQALAEAFALYAPETVCLGLIQQGLAALGDDWYKGRVTVQQEHFASALALRRIANLLAAAPRPTRAGRILIGCPPDEEHTFAPLLLALLLRRRGWDVVYLGANVPLTNLEATIAATRPRLVILTAQQLATAGGLLAMAETLLRQQIPLAYGGLIFSRIPDLTLAIPGHFLGHRLDAATAVIEQLLAAPHVRTAARTATPAQQDALAQFRTCQPQIDAEVSRRTAGMPLPPQAFATANLHFGRSLGAALALGSIEAAAADIAWLEGLLVNHAGMPPEHADIYLAAYLEAARTVLDGRGRLLTGWLAALAAGEAAAYPQGA